MYLFVKLSEDGAPSAVSDTAGVLLGLEIPFFYRALHEIRFLELGLFHLAGALIVWASTDIAAYFVDSKWGATPLAPKVSPHKTLEGALGGITAGVVLLNVFSWPCSRLVTIHFGRIWVYAATASVAGQLGDLSMSAIKRIAGVKDFGHILPGHGGILDRFDSLLYILPYTYLFYWIVGPLVSR